MQRYLLCRKGGGVEGSDCMSRDLMSMSNDSIQDMTRDDVIHDHLVASEHGSGDHSWRHKVMEVVPILAIVALAAIGAVLYLIVVDGLWPDGRAEFSLNCAIGRGEWVRSSEKPFYSSFCPYMRDAWNCHKFGLNTPLDYYRWQPTECLLPPFDPHEFLHVMQNKRVAFVGDESGANAFDSLVCMLSEAATPVLVSGGTGNSVAQEERQLASTSPEDESASGVDSSHSLSSSWHTLSKWPFGWSSSGPATSIPDSSIQKTDEEGVWSSKKMAYSFPSHNFTLVLYDSPLLIRATREISVNVTACQLSKSQNLLSSSSSNIGNRFGSTSTEVPSSSIKNDTHSETAGVSGDFLQSCYPNQIEIDKPDPLWASEASLLDVIVFNSGKEWREEAVELQGLGIYSGGERQREMSMEGLVGVWAYPLAIEGVATWLRDPANFRGKAIFRSYTPAHQRKECAGRLMLPNEEEAIRAVRENDFDRYDKAVVKAIEKSKSDVFFVNVTMMSAERGDGHPWMASPFRPKTDCTNWCLPGIPDTWNEVLSAVLLQMYGKDRPSDLSTKRGGGGHG